MSDVLRIGYARSAITPPIGVRLEGYEERLEFSRCIYDDLYAKCLTFDVGGNRFVSVVSVDLIGVPYSVYMDVNGMVRELGGVEVLLGASHSHAAPSPITDSFYREYFVKSVVGCVKASLSNVRNVPHAIVGRGSLPQLVYNRRKPLGGVIDPDVIVFNTGFASVINFTSHPVILGPDNLCISSDYPGAVERFFKYLAGREAIFLNGCCGNINPYTVTTDIGKPYDRRGGSYYEVERYGRIVALETLKSIELGERIDLSKCVVDYKSSVVNLKLRKEVMEFIEGFDVDKAIAELEKQGRVYDAWRLKMAKIIINEIDGKRALPAPIAVLRICNEVAMVFLPAEVFVEHQLYIKNRSPFKYTMVACYFNSYWMYIPTIEAFSEKGYEVEVPLSIIEPGEGERLREEAVKLLDELHYE
jgi:neutral ceramidase